LKHLIFGQTFDQERALYNLKDTEVRNCTFAGPADGESALKEARQVLVADCSFSLRYPFWHTEWFYVQNCTLDEKTRARMWYSTDGEVKDCRIESVKCLRECRNMRFENTFVRSSEFGWRCDGLKIKNCDMAGEYFLFESKNARISGLKMQGKYSFQYTENFLVTDSVLDTKDAFWHSKNCTVKNCTVKGEYLGWYSEGLTLVDCHIVGTQPLCYCKDLTLINCTTEGCDLSFEYSAVNAEIKGEILSVKNPRSGRIVADGYGEIVREGSVMESECEIIKRAL
jgi:hypothetical protein